MSLTGNIVVDQDLVGSLKWPSLDVTKRPTQRFKTREIDSIDDFDAAAGCDLPDDRTYHFNVRHLADHVSDLYRYRCATDTCQEGRPGGLHDHVGSNARGAVLGIVHDSITQTYDKQNQCYFQCDRDNANH